MSYRPGSYGLERIGIPSGPPTIACDGEGCSVRFEVKGRGMGSVPPAWFLDGKAVPNWSGGRRKDGIRVDYCPKCRFDSRGKQEPSGLPLL